MKKNELTNQFTLVINAGGESRRMGQSKALLPVPSADGQPTRPLIAHIADRLRPLSPDRIIVVTNDDEIVARSGVSDPVEFVRDAYAGAGALGGIATALEMVDEWAIVVACDMPLVNLRVFEYMCRLLLTTGERARGSCATVPEMADRVDVIVPMVGGYAQTLYAIYHRRCLPAIGTQLANEERKITRFFPKVNVREVTEDEIRPLDPEFRSFMNANTPEEWAQTLGYLKKADA